MEYNKIIYFVDIDLSLYEVFDLFMGINISWILDDEKNIKFF